MRQYRQLGLNSLELPIEKVGLYHIKGPSVPVSQTSQRVGVNLSTILLRPMQFFVKYHVDHKTGITGQKIYLQQVVTPFVGGYYTQTKGYYYLINTKKAAAVQRLLVNLNHIEIEIDNLITEANRFMYMYCHL